MIEPPFDLTGRVAVITGGARNIGLACASGLCRDTPAEDESDAASSPTGTVTLVGGGYTCW